MSVQSEKIGVIIPCFNESNTILQLINELDRVLDELDQSFEIVVVNDGSTDDTFDELINLKNENDVKTKLSILNLAYNVGHQEAIYQGIVYSDKMNFMKVVVMDGDGEDDPLAIKQLLSVKNADIVKVQRGKRNESFLFQSMYRFYRLIFWLITGKKMDFGNYCLINRSTIQSLKNQPFVHLAARLEKLKIKSKKIKVDRRLRIDGKSKMGYQNLVYHGFKSLIEFAEDMLMMFLKLFIILIGSFILSAAYIFYLKYFTAKAIPGWASNVTLHLFNSSLICIGIFLLGVLMMNMIKRNENRSKEIYSKH